jgi:hypothetical protein
MMNKPIGLHVQVLGAVSLVAQVLIAQGCSSSNNPSTTGQGTAGTTGSGTGTAGTTGSGTGTAGTTGSGTAGTTGSAGSTATGTAGTTGSGGGGFGQPACPTNTVAGVALAKGVACDTTMGDPALCYKTCGPVKTGVKSEMCMTAGYQEMSGCSFDMTANYACYKIPAAANSTCPVGDGGAGTYLTPQASQPCTVDQCVLCNSTGGIVGGSYLDSNGNSKTGYCVCQAPNSAGTRTWSCSSDTAWPCPAGMGC